jgi:tight adherence protein C
MINQVTTTPGVFSMLAFLVLFLLLIGVYQYIRQSARKREVLRKIRYDSEAQVPRREEGQSSEAGHRGRTLLVKFLGLLGRTGGTDNADYSGMRIKFLRAGLRGENLAAVFWGTKILLAVGMAVCFLAVRMSMLAGLSQLATLVGVLYFAFFGYYLPDIWLRIRTARRKKKIFNGLPDTLDLLVVCVEAGMGLDAAITRVGEEIRFTDRELSDELRLLNLELRAGKTRLEALRNLGRRVNLEDMNSLITLLVQTEKFGTSIAQALRVYSDTFRTKRYQAAEELAAKIPVKLLFPLIFFIFPAIFVVILGPAIIQIFRVFTGNAL